MKEETKSFWGAFEHLGWRSRKKKEIVEIPEKLMMVLRKCVSDYFPEFHNGFGLEYRLNGLRDRWHYSVWRRDLLVISLKCEGPPEDQSDIRRVAREFTSDFLQKEGIDWITVILRYDLHGPSSDLRDHDTTRTTRKGKNHGFTR